MEKLHCGLADEFDAFLRTTTHFLLQKNNVDEERSSRWQHGRK